MRWASQEVKQQDEGRLPGVGEAVVRTFDAPEALDIRFHEVRTKSALNRVPNASRLPFSWTVNPYRGCTHACVYCVAGDTRVLLADGRPRAIADLHIGDEIYGTAHGRYVKTEVRAHWRTLKPAFRLTLEDGTRLVASGDHRFLTRRGWKHVAGAKGGADRRPHLTPDDTLLGLGRLGEPAEELRSVQLVDTAVTPKRSIEGRAVESPAGLRVAEIEPLGVEIPMYDITTGTGDFVAEGVISHNCFARPTHEFLDMNAGRDFEREIIVKVNVPEVLRAELARPSWKGERVALGTNTDPYQWVEGRYKLMRGIWEALRDFRNPCSILTKSPLVLRDVDLLKQIAHVTEVSACLSVPTLEEKAWRATEPHTPHPRARLEAVAELNRQGIPTGVLMAPLMPGINDAPADVQKLVDAATEAGATYIGGQTLFLRGSVRDIVFEWLREQRPDLVPRYERLYANGAYVAAPERRSIELAAGAPWATRDYPADRYRHRGAARRRPEPVPAVAPARHKQGTLF